MRIIFQDGGVAELTNVDKIVIYNEGEYNILGQAMCDYISKEGPYEYPSDQESSDGSLSERNMASESTQHAGQTGVCDLPSEGGREEVP